MDLDQSVLTELLDALRSGGSGPIPVALFARIIARPRHDHINLNGRYYFTPSAAVARGELRVLGSVSP